MHLDNFSFGEGHQTHGLRIPPLGLFQSLSENAHPKYIVKHRLMLP
jgi:hypothetical protein